MTDYDDFPDDAERERCIAESLKWDVHLWVGDIASGAYANPDRVALFVLYGIFNGK